jgi:hypothetical protein
LENFFSFFTLIVNRKNALDDDEQQQNDDFCGGFFLLSPPKGFKEEMSFSSPPNALDGTNWKRKRKTTITTNL